MKICNLSEKKQRKNNNELHELNEFAAPARDEFISTFSVLQLKGNKRQIWNNDIYLETNWNNENNEPII